MALTDDVALTDEVSRFYWTKFLCTVDRWCGSISVDKKLYVQYMYIHRIIFNQTASLFKPHHYSNCVVKSCHYSNRVVKPRTIDWWRGAILSVQNIFNPMAMIYTQCIYKKGVSPPNLASFNSFLSSIFSNSFFILYFLRILINFYFAPSSIMNS